jgi:hypothetical protein
MDFQIGESAARIVAIFAGVIFGSAAIGSSCVVWVRKQIFGYGGSGLCFAGVILLGLSIWHSVEFGVGSSGLSFKAARDIVVSAASSADQATNAAKAVEQAAAAAATNNPDPAKRAEIEKATQDAKKAAADAQRHLQDVTRNLGTAFGKRVCIPWC